MTIESCNQLGACKPGILAGKEFLMWVTDIDTFSILKGVFDVLGVHSISMSTDWSENVRQVEHTDFCFGTSVLVNIDEQTSSISLVACLIVTGLLAG